jgi:hypothetical protein
MRPRCPRGAGLLLLASALGACEPAVDDSGEPTTDTTWPGLDALGPEQLQPPDGLWQADYSTVPPDRGLIWERDPGFFIADFTVPHIVVRGDGSFMMLATNMQEPFGRWHLESPDGLSWTPAEQPLFEPDDFPQDCGNRLEDGTVIHAEDGSYRLLLEGTMLDEQTHTTDWRVWCQALSPDGLSFEPAEGYFYEGSETDDRLPSVPTPLHLRDWSALIYYMGDIYSELGGHIDGNGIRIAHAEAGSDHAEPWITENVLPEGQMDPMPVYLEGGGLRLYHTSTASFDGSGGRAGPGPGMTESEDGRSFGGVQRLLELEGHCFQQQGGECLLDPFFLHLDDGTLVLYYTYLRSEAGTAEDPGAFTEIGIGRAFALD